MIRTRAATHDEHRTRAHGTPASAATRTPSRPFTRRADAHVPPAFLGARGERYDLTMDERTWALNALERQVTAGLRGRLGNREDAEDLWGETREAVLKYRGAFSGGFGGFATFMWSVAGNKAATLLRRRHTRAAASAADPHGLDTIAPAVALDGHAPYESAGDARIADALREAIAELPQGQYAAARCVWLDGMDTADAAASLGVSEAAIRQRLCGARGHLRTHLTRAGVAVRSGRPYPASRARARVLMVTRSPLLTAGTARARRPREARREAHRREVELPHTADVTWRSEVLAKGGLQAAAPCHEATGVVAEEGAESVADPAPPALDAVEGIVGNFVERRAGTRPATRSAVGTSVRRPAG